jgi:hypothetical protein
VEPALEEVEHVAVIHSEDQEESQASPSPLDQGDSVVSLVLLEEEGVVVATRSLVSVCE